MFSYGIRTELFKYFPEEIMKVFCLLKDESLKNIEEIRLRTGKPVMIYAFDGSGYLTREGILTRDLRQKCISLNEEDMKNVFFSLAKHSVYAYEADIKNGFITIDSGYRVGIAGSVISDGGKIKGFKHINALNIRIPRQIKGISKGLLPHISENGRLLSALIVSAPQLGKTTLIRDIARAAGNGEFLKRHKTCIIDERSEIAALKEGSPQFNVGLETDVIDGVNKSEGMTMALRALSPDVIITDEIGRESDLSAIRESINCGVSIIATAHGSSLSDIRKRLFFNKILAEKAFERIVVLDDGLGKITVNTIYDGLQRPIMTQPTLLKG